MASIIPDTYRAAQVKVVMQECAWLEQVIRARVKSTVAAEGLPAAPPALEETSAYAAFIAANTITAEQRLLIALALAPHLRPDFFNLLLHSLLGKEIPAAESRLLALRKSSTSDHFAPTGLTFLYLLAGTFPAARIEATALLTESSPLGQQAVIGIEPHLKGEPTLSGRLFISEKWLEIFLYGKEAAADSVKYWSLHS